MSMNIGKYIHNYEDFYEKFIYQISSKIFIN